MTRPALRSLVALVLALAAPASASAATGFVSSNNSSQLFPLNSVTNVLGPPIAVPSPRTIAFAPVGGTAYVVSQFGDAVVPVDAATNTAGTPIPAGDQPIAIAMAPDGATAYVGGYTSGDVTPIDTATNTAGTPIPAGGLVGGLAVSPDGSTVWAVSAAADAVIPIDAATGAPATPIPMPVNPFAAAITPDGSTLYVTGQSTNTVTPVDTASRTAGATIPVGTTPLGVAISPDGKTAWVASFTDSVSVIDVATNTVVDTIALPGEPHDLAFTPDGKTVYVVADFTVVPIDVATRTTGTPLPAGNNNRGIAFVPAQAPIAAFGASTSTGSLRAELDASATTVPLGGMAATYEWSFGDGTTATTTSPTVAHDYAAAGAYDVTLTVTSADGCSTARVFTGSNVMCNGSSVARVTHAVTVPKAAPPAPPAPPVTQRIERFALGSRCVRAGTNRKARIPMTLVMTMPGAIDVRVDRAVGSRGATRCPKKNADKRFAGRLRQVRTLNDVATRAASVTRKTTLDLRLAPGLYRITARPVIDGGTGRPTYRWVRVLRR